MYAWSILAAVATFAAAANTTDDTTTTPTTYTGAGPTVQDEATTPADLMTTTVTVTPQAVSDNAKKVARTVTLAGAAAGSEKFEATATTETALATPTTTACVTVSGTNGKYECYSAEITYNEENTMLLATLRLTDDLPYTPKVSPQMAVERRLAGTANAVTETKCERTIKLEAGKDPEEVNKVGDETTCAAFTVEPMDQNKVTDATTAWSAVMVYEETLTTEEEATTALTTLGSAMAKVDVQATVTKSSTEYTADSDSVELAAEKKPDDGGDDKPDDGGDSGDGGDDSGDGGDDSGDGGDDKDGAATLAAAAGAAISAAAFLF